jgi:hypothetical protein
LLQSSDVELASNGLSVDFFPPTVSPYSRPPLSLFEIETSLLVTLPSKQNSSFV